MRRTYLLWQESEEFEYGGDEFRAEVSLFIGNVGYRIATGVGLQESPRIEFVSFPDNFLPNNCH